MERKKHTRTILKLIALAWLITITILSLLPPDSGVETPTNDKINHFMAYGTLAYVTCWIYPKRHLRLLYIMLFLSLFSATIEWIQPYFNRECSLLDFVANCCGLMLGWAIYLGHLQVMRFRRR